MPLRPYQQNAHDAAIAWVKQSTLPCLIEAATGAGKSHIIAAISYTLHQVSGGKHVMCLAPTAELVGQNREKFLATGMPASVYSASAGQKCLKHPVVFGTPGTVKSKARAIGHLFCAIIVDEADGITPTVIAIIDAMRAGNPNIRVIGLTATPFRLKTGYIYHMDEHGRAYGPDQAIAPYFTRKVYTITARELLDQGYLTPPRIGAINAGTYETSHIQLKSNGKFDEAEIDRAFVGHGRKTAGIIAEVVHNSRDRKGVMIFAATVQHAHEIMASLPPELSVLVTGSMAKDERRKAISEFKSQRRKYIVNVNVLTVGFDAPHVDHIVIMRLTESPRLLEQIIGRGTRLYDGKTEFLVSDYAGNLDRHCPDGDIFKPQIKTSKQQGEGFTMEVSCPICSVKLAFSGRENKENYDVDEHGYFCLHGAQIMSDYGPMPAHYGRRCYGVDPRGNQCSYRWTSKPCPHCNEPNDIAARYCTECRGEIIDPNEKLIGDFKAAKKDPDRVQTDRLESFSYKEVVTQSGRTCMRADFVTNYRSFSVWFHDGERRQHESFLKATNGGVDMPSTITYRREPGKTFYKTLAFGLPEDTPESIAA